MVNDALQFVLERVVVGWGKQVVLDLPHFRIKVSNELDSAA